MAMNTLQHILYYRDAILGPIYFLLLLWWVSRWRKKHYKNSPLKKYIFPAFILKAMCCVLMAFLYEYYYGYSDSHNYYTGAIDVWNATKENPVYGLELVFLPLKDCSPQALQFAEYMTNPAFSASIVNMFKFSGFIGMFCVGTYLPIALIITLLSFIGSWKIFMVFVEEFPAHYKKIALTCLFAPSFVFWTTSIMKDPICIYGLGLCVSGLYNLMKGRSKLLNLFSIWFGAFLLLSFKGYIFYLFSLAALVSVYIHLMTNSKKKYRLLIRIMAFFALIFITIFVISRREHLAELFTTGFFNDVSSIQNVQKDQGGSVYVLPNVDDASFFGVIRTYLNSLNVALFRPYLWEIPNLIATANALESFTVLIVTAYLLFKLKIVGFFTTAFKNRVLAFALIFTLLLAPLAGLVSFNFGTLVRYKSPIVPFYYTYLMLLYYKTKGSLKVKKITKLSTVASL